MASENSPLRSLIASGTKLYLDSVDPEAVKKNRALGATGATSNPIIIADIVKQGRLDDVIAQRVKEGHDSKSIAWYLTDMLVKDAQAVFLPVWQETRGNEGWVSFELDPLLEDQSFTGSDDERIAQYVELGKHWSKDHKNRMIKVPATPGGLGALEELAAAGVTLNVTLIFSMRQYEAARDAVWRGAQRRPGGLDGFKSVYSIFVSRLDAYTETAYPQLTAAQGQVGIVNAKRIWRQNQDFWAANPTPLQQEMIFASTGTKKKSDPPWKYVEAFAGSDIETNPPATNEAVEASGRTIARQVDRMPESDVLAEVDRVVDMARLEADLMAEGLKKFADPQKALLELIEERAAAAT